MLAHTGTSKLESVFVSGSRGSRTLACARFSAYCGEVQALAMIQYRIFRCQNECSHVCADALLLSAGRQETMFFTRRLRKTTSSNGRVRWNGGILLSFEMSTAWTVAVNEAKTIPAFRPPRGDIGAHFARQESFDVPATLTVVDS